MYNFLVTSYTYPLAEPVMLSERLNLYLDNPRTTEEVEVVRSYIERAYSTGSPWRVPDYSDEDIVTLEQIALDFCRMYAARDPVVQSFCDTYKRDDLFDFLARMWIIARYDDEGQHELLDDIKEQQPDDRPYVILLQDEHPIVKNSKQLADYSFLLSLLVHTQGESYFGQSFILHSDYYDLAEAFPNHDLCREFLMFGFACRSGKAGLDMDHQWRIFPAARDGLVKTGRLLDSALDAGATEKLLYVASLLKAVGEDITDERTKLTVLVSIMELMLTHNPDFNRYNVEDSISKQFALKASILIYLHDRSHSLAAIRSRLRTIYALRSNIAHGNFEEVTKYVRNLSKKEGREEYFQDVITDSYCYIRAILYEYLKDPVFVDFLKGN